MIDRIILIGENHDGPDGTKGEPGFAAIIENKGKRILFDTGLTELTVANADALGVDLTKLDAIVLSHNHFDHTGGLMATLARCGETDVYIRPTFFEGSFAQKGGQAKYIGPQFKQTEYEAAGARFREIDITPEWIDDAILVSGPVPGPVCPFAAFLLPSGVASATFEARGGLPALSWRMPWASGRLYLRSGGPWSTCTCPATLSRSCCCTAWWWASSCSSACK